MKIQAIVDYTNKEFFNAIQEFCVLELNIQVIPIENSNELAQYIEKFVFKRFMIFITLSVRNQLLLKLDSLRNPRRGQESVPQGLDRKHERFNSSQRTLSKLLEDCAEDRR